MRVFILYFYIYGRKYFSDFTYNVSQMAHLFAILAGVLSASYFD